MFHEMVKEMSPYKRMGKTDDVTPLVDFLVSEGARWITGQVIGPNGGMSM
jgi:3-oxoacyl-[acyl-carrier protein] reductase